MLTEPYFPYQLLYLYRIFKVLDGMRPEAFTGLASLTADQIGWSNQLFHWNLEPREVEALTFLDHVSRDSLSYIEKRRKQLYG